MSWTSPVTLNVSSNSGQKLTAALMYEKIRSRKSVPELYEEKLIVGAQYAHQPDARPTMS